ncbi:MAG: carboxypeptidase regulatory-like domain-containing protein, partial [Deltaproteobacteria bacterium]|nr:carboxypeptidase regulatory-like domain-containing protein [Deltaproteobacteria bacterium]
DVVGPDFVSTIEVEVAADITTRAPDPSCFVGKLDGYVCHPTRNELVRDAIVSGVGPSGGVVEAVTDQAGYFFLAGLATGPQTLDIVGSDFVSSIDVDVVANVTTRAPDPNCFVTGTGTITGRICATEEGIGSGEGYYLTGARISVTVGVDVYETTTDNEGYFTLTGVPAGSHIMLVEKGSFTASAQVDVTAGEVTNVDHVCVAPQSELAVVTGTFDSIEDVLLGMGFAVRECVPLGFCGRPLDTRGTITLIDGESTAFITDFLDDSVFLNQFDIVFFNCGLADQYVLSAPDTAKDNLRDYVQNGGSIYASDRAYEIVRVVFPGVLDFYGNDTDGTYRAPDGWVGVLNPGVATDVVDSSLAGALGVGSVTIVYDKGRWVPLTNTQPGAVYAWLQADVAVDTSDPPDDVADTTWVDAPTLASTPFGSGRIVFTTFHNSAQITAEMTAILRFIVFEL